MSLIPYIILFLLSTVSSQNDNPCKSFGVDYQEGGSYFQNVKANEPFSFVSYFEGCQKDKVNNILVDPKGKQYLCSNTQLLPSDVPEVSICPLNNTQLTSGPWSVIILSNNGNAAPIAYQRDFTLIVGTQVTITVTPTITANYTSTSVFNMTSTLSITNTTTLEAKTTTVPRTTIHKTKTITPKTTSTITKVLYTISKVIPSVTVVKTTTTKTPKCKLPHKPTAPDKTCRIKPTIVPAAVFNGGTKIADSLLPTPTLASPELPDLGALSSLIIPVTVGFGDKAGGDVAWPTQLVPMVLPMPGLHRHRGDRRGVDHAHFHLRHMGGGAGGRSSGVELLKRAPDLATVTVTESETSLWVTVTSTIAGPTTTATVTEVVYVNSTVTPAEVTVHKGATKASQQTVTASRITKSITKYVIATVTSTKVQTVKHTVTATVSGAKRACKQLGGSLGGSGDRGR